MAACRGHSTVFPCTRVQCVTARSAAAGSPVLQSCCRSPGAWDRRVRSARDASGREVLDDQRLVARIQPVPGRLIDSDVQMADPRRVAEGSWALDENDAKIFGMVLNDRPVRGRGRREAAVRPSEAPATSVWRCPAGRAPHGPGRRGNRQREDGTGSKGCAFSGGGHEAAPWRATLRVSVARGCGLESRGSAAP
jgi:hypothetical protein